MQNTKPFRYTLIRLDLPSYVFIWDEEDWKDEGFRKMSVAEIIGADWLNDLNNGVYFSRRSKSTVLYKTENGVYTHRKHEDGKQDHEQKMYDLKLLNHKWLRQVEYDLIGELIKHGTIKTKSKLAELYYTQKLLLDVRDIHLNASRFKLEYLADETLKDYQEGKTKVLNLDDP